jgi:glucose dehydrogenase
MRATIFGRVGVVLLLGAGTAVVAAQQAAPPPLVTAADIQAGLPADGSRWLTFGGNYTNQRHSPLTQINPSNVSRLIPLHGPLCFCGVVMQFWVIRITLRK